MQLDHSNVEHLKSGMTKLGKTTECSYYGDISRRSTNQRKAKDDGRPIFSMSHINFDELHATKAHSIPIISQIRTSVQTPMIRSFSYPFILKDMDENN